MEIVVVDFIFLSSVRNCKMSKNVRKPSEIVAIPQGRSDVLTYTRILNDFVR